MNENKQKTEPQPSNWFRKIVTGGSHKSMKHSPFYLLTIFLTGLSLGVCAQENPVLSDAFKRVDKNGDGKLSANEVNGFPRLKEHLKGADENGDGLITFEEFRTHLSAGTRPPTAPSSPVTRLGPGEHIRTITVGSLQRRYRVYPSSDSLVYA